jgi:predicted lipoprotein with Yx(FWY)xxD motif
VVGIVAVLVLSAALSACASRTGHDPGARPLSSARPRPGSAGSAGAPVGHKTALIMAMPSSLGPVVTDDYMLTLYRSDKDTASPSASNCTGACAVQWPPVLIDGTVTYAGGDQSLVGSVTRPDGARQLTLKGWPLYRFAGDRAEGDTNGHGLEGLWSP